WQEVQGQIYVVRLAIEGTDRRGLYADIAEAVTSTGTNIKSVELRTGDGGVSGTMLVEVENLSHLQKVIRTVRKVKGVTDVARRERHGSEDN
ncbi:MAG TPA: ACT domain-containing protein, partial [Gemmatimonadaceae bacterium]|nr:ACT domain-containing protein [Gemmatimonadaceae bacterium]